MQKEIDWLARAEYYGKEAAANGRRHMSADDREDIALAYGVSRWLDIPFYERDAAMECFRRGWDIEKRNQRGF